MKMNKPNKVQLDESEETSNFDNMIDIKEDALRKINKFIKNEESERNIIRNINTNQLRNNSYQDNETEGYYTSSNQYNYYDNVNAVFNSNDANNYTYNNPDIANTKEHKDYLNLLKKNTSEINHNSNILAKQQKYPFVTNDEFEQMNEIHHTMNDHFIDHSLSVPFEKQLTTKHEVTEGTESKAQNNHNNIFNIKENDLNNMGKVSNKTVSNFIMSKEIQDKDIQVVFCFFNKLENSLFYDIYSIIKLCPKLTKLIKLNPKQRKITINLPEEVSSSDLLEYFFICKNGFDNDINPQVSKLLLLSSLLGNDELASAIIKTEIDNLRISKFTAIRYISIAYDRMTDNICTDIDSSWLNLFFTSIEIVARNLLFYLSNSNYNIKILKLNKKILEEVVDKYLSFLSRSNIVLDEEEAKVRTKLNVALISKDNIKSAIGLLLYAKHSNEINFNEEELTAYGLNSEILKTEGSERALKLNDFLLNKLMPSSNLVKVFVEEYYSIKHDEVINEVFSLSKPMFVITIERFFENFYKEIPLLVSGNKVVFTLIVFYRKHDDCLEFTLKSQNNSYEENELLPNLFQNLVVMFTLSMNNISTFDDVKLIDSLTDQSQKIFSLSNFRKKIQPETMKRKEDITITINSRIFYFLSCLVYMLSKDFFLYYNLLDIRKVPKSIFINILKLLILNKSSEFDSRKVVVAISNWLSDENNCLEDIGEILDYIDFEYVDIDLLMEICVKLSKTLMENSSLKSLFISKLSKRLKVKDTAADEVVKVLVDSFINTSCKVLNHKISAFEVATVIPDQPCNNHRRNLDSQGIFVPKLNNFSSKINNLKDPKHNHCDYSPIPKQESFTENLSENSKINKLITTKNFLPSDSQHKNKISNSNSECISKKQPESRSNSKGVKNPYKKMRKIEKGNNSFKNHFIPNEKQPFSADINKATGKFKTLNNTKKLFYETPQTQTQSQQNSTLNNDAYKEFEKKLNMKTRNLANYLMDKRDSKSKLRTLHSQTTQKIANIISNTNNKNNLNKKKGNIRGGTLIQYMFK